MGKTEKGAIWLNKKIFLVIIVCIKGVFPSLFSIFTFTFFFNIPNAVKVQKLSGCSYFDF